MPGFCVVISAGLGEIAPADESGEDEDENDEEEDKGTTDDSSEGSALDFATQCLADDNVITVLAC